MGSNPTDAAADGLHHRYASVLLTRSGDVINRSCVLGSGAEISSASIDTMCIKLRTIYLFI